MLRTFETDGYKLIEEGEGVTGIIISHYFNPLISAPEIHSPLHLGAVLRKRYDCIINYPVPKLVFIPWNVLQVDGLHQSRGEDLPFPLTIWGFSVSRVLRRFAGGELLSVLSSSVVCYSQGLF